MEAEFYRGYLPDDRSLGPLSVVLASSVALSPFFYLLSLASPV
jgi:hypothetical protein